MAKKISNYFKAVLKAALTLLLVIFSFLIKWFIEYMPEVLNWLSSQHKSIAKLNTKIVITGLMSRTRERPHPWSTVHSYVSWRSLTEKHFSARHLPESGIKRSLDKAQIKTNETELFRNRNDKQRECVKSTLLFPAFAQYLTDGFIRTRIPETEDEDEELRLQNQSNNQIDLSTLYGRTNKQTNALRRKSESIEDRGKLKSQILNVEGCEKQEYAPFLLDDEGKIKDEFLALDHPSMMTKFEGDPRLTTLFAFGGDRTNAVPQVAAINTLFLREHNRIASLISKENIEWDDDRVFEVARNVNIVIFIKIIVEDYINHISRGFKFIASPEAAWDAKWNKPNWITTEFSLLYRWHSLVPEYINWGGVEPISIKDTILNNQPLISCGLASTFNLLSKQAATELGPMNTADTLLNFETEAIHQGRLAKLKTYNDYRVHLSLPKAKSFSDISNDAAVQKKLRDLYGSVENVEYYTGMFSESQSSDSPLPEMMMYFVSIDAFSQALTNPLLSKAVWQQEHKVFSRVGWEIINSTSTLNDVLIRNVSKKELENLDLVSFTRKGWRRKYTIKRTLSEWRDNFLNKKKEG